MKDKVFRYWTYFRRGHGAYLTFFLSFANFMAIQYSLLVQYLPLLEVLFSSLASFAASFFVVYVPVATIIGWLDYKKLAVPVDAAVEAQANPWVRDLAKGLMLMIDRRYGEAKEIFRKWVEV